MGVTRLPQRPCGAGVSVIFALVGDVIKAPENLWTWISQVVAAEFSHFAGRLRLRDTAVHIFFPVTFSVPHVIKAAYFCAAKPRFPFSQFVGKCCILLTFTGKVRIEFRATKPVLLTTRRFMSRNWLRQRL